MIDDKNSSFIIHHSSLKKKTMNQKTMEYVYMAIGVFILYGKSQKAVLTTWDYVMVALCFVAIGLSIYRLFIKKN